jgi:hypothetical protein
MSTLSDEVRRIVSNALPLSHSVDSGGPKQQMPDHSPDAMQETKTSGNGSRTTIPWPVIWAMIAFLSGTLFSAGMGWGRNSTSLDNIALAISRLEGEVNALTEKYTSTDKSVGQELQKIEDHLTYDDNRLDRLETPGSSINHK